MNREELTKAILLVKNNSSFSWKDIAQTVNLSECFVVAGILGQQRIPLEAGRKICQLLQLDVSNAEILNTIPTRGCIPTVPTDPTIYRFYEVLQVYGTTLKELINEEFGDGIMSAIDFKMNVEKIEDNEGNPRVVVTMDGKFLPYNPF